MSILAADKKAIALSPVTTTRDMADYAGGSSIVHDHKKLTLILNKSLALGIAGNTQDHYYTPTLAMSASILEVLGKIRKHMEGFLRVYDLTGLSTVTSFVTNQAIATFFDKATGMYLSNEFLFTPVRNQTRLHRGNDEVKVLYAGSGSEAFEKAGGLSDIDSFIGSTKNSCTPEACIPWMQDAFRKVSAINADIGEEPVFVVSTRSNPKFRSIECRQTFVDGP
jgi:hypothetical protein